MNARPSPKRTWEIHQLLLPILFGVAVAISGWALQAAAESRYDRLTAEDERRIVREGQEYVDKQLTMLRKDIAMLHQDLSDLRDLQNQILLTLRSQK